MNEWEWHLLEDRPPVASIDVGGIDVRAGARVRLRPRDGGDVMDLALAGQIATVEAIEQDYEGQVQLAVVLDDDPGRDLGLLRQPGHRFFFRPAEVEALGTDISPEPAPSTAPTILVAGVGNLFMGDDAFGIEVAQRLARRPLPDGVRVVDFGIRGFDLAAALVDGADVSILVDACPRGAAPGTVFLIEPDRDALDAPDSPPAALEAHGLDPLSVLRLAQQMDGSLKTILLVGCEPQFCGGDDGHIGLSDPVEAAIEVAISMIEALIGRIRNGSWTPLEDVKDGA
jgi:hydrogenase maturation protease